MKVLLIEDDRKIAAAVRRGLEAEGFHVEIATDGIDGLWRATEGSYDVILLDILLPGRASGVRRPRDAGTWIPILTLTAKVRPGSVGAEGVTLASLRRCQ